MIYFLINFKKAKKKIVNFQSFVSLIFYSLFTSDKVDVFTDYNWKFILPKDNVPIYSIM